MCVCVKKLCVKDGVTNLRVQEGGGGGGGEEEERRRRGGEEEERRRSRNGEVQIQNKNPTQ